MLSQLSRISRVSARAFAIPRTSLLASNVAAARCLPAVGSSALMAAKRFTSAVRLSQAANASAAPSAAYYFGPHDTFERRHIGPGPKEVEHMLKVIGVSSIDELIEQTVPKAIRLKKPLAVDGGRGEAATLAEFKQMMSQNKIYRSHIGTGYYGTITPPVILRNILENPGWYTPYTPYSAEIAQGRLEMLLNYQTMICDLTGLPVSNASLLDEATAAAEAMNLCRSDSKRVFLIADDVHPQTIETVRTRAEVLGVTIKVVNPAQLDFSAGDVNGVLIQYPATDGRVANYKDLVAKAHAGGALVVCASDLLALTVLTPPGEWGADCVIGSAQRFGVPFGFGGPHAAFIATREDIKRKIPGRVIGVSRDDRGKTALRMAMQTREQHIRRDKATSNICTAQALLANIAAAYAIYHGPSGLKQIASKVHAHARVFAEGVKQLGYTVQHATFFDTVRVKVPSSISIDTIKTRTEKAGINLRYFPDKSFSASFDETTDLSHIDDLFKCLAPSGASSVNAKALSSSVKVEVPAEFSRTSAYLTHPVFHMYHAEHEMLRYLFKLQSKDLSLQTAMIPLGSCTMKLNATSEMIPITWPEVNNMHPFAPVNQTKGYTDLLNELERDLAHITGFHAVSFQSQAGSQGEYSGLLTIRAYHLSRGDANRTICLIPTSAHGTNPASAVMAGMKVVVVACDKDGNIDVADLKAKAEQHKQNLAALMVTYPSTHGVFETTIKDICKIVHDNGGQVYMDGANMNAQVGLTSPGEIGADVCHLNLHKTFCIPHGGGGPGMGPICVAKHLAPFLPGHPLIKSGGEKSFGTIAGAPYSSASIVPISYMYIRMMGGQGLTDATKYAILSANYMARRLGAHYPILYKGANGNVAHEFIVDLRPLKAATGITEEDVAKRLMDYNFHAPTMSFPVPGTLMVEPTESESLYELDRFCDALISIRKEIAEVESGVADKTNNVLKRAPHTAEAVLADKWDRPYPREKGAYPLPYLRDNKFWPSVGRIDNVYGDRNVICTCPPIEAYTNSQ